MDEKPRAAIRVQKPLEITYSSNCPPIDGRTQDISETGLYIDSSNPLEVGSPIEFSLELPDETPDVPIRGKGTVVWSEPMNGFGIRYEEMSQEDRERIRFFVASVFFLEEGGRL